MARAERILCNCIRLSAKSGAAALLCIIVPLSLQAQSRNALDRLLFEAGPLPGAVQPLVASREVASREVASREVASREVASQEAASRESASREGASRESASADRSADARLATSPDNISALATGNDGTAVLPAELLQPQDFGARNIELYLQAIADEQLENGPFAPELLQQYMALGETYQQQDDHEAALEALEKAEHISRITNGLYAPEQFSIIESIIESLVATGDLQKANEKQQYLLFLNQQFHGVGSLQVVDALHTLADWNMDAFRSVLRLANGSGLTIGLNSRSGGSVSPRMLAFGNLYRAQNHYYQAILNLVNHRQTRSPQLLELEHNLIEAVFLGAYRDGILDEPEFYLDKRRTRTGSRISRDSVSANSISFINGRNAWTRMRIYLENNPAPDPLDVAKSIIGLGDWYMLFNRRLSGLQQYELAWRYLQAQDVPESTIAALLTPELPQQLPAFTPLPHSREKFGLRDDATIEYDGFIDLTFRLSRFGNVRQVEVSDRSENATPQIERRLKRLLRSSPFRPRLFDGVPAQDDKFALRYSFAVIE